MEDRLNLKRFLDAQSTSYEQALTEIKNGRKKSCWMWYIFPQYKGIGRSITSMEYAIQSQEEANVYINHPILGVRLLEITEAFLSLENKTAYEVLGKPDNLKIKSSMTLFDSIQNENDLFDSVLKKYFKGSRCTSTINGLKNE
tara:strand:- start:327 stop:755 length:429 start_codon:yes stop_codon:yes gene_type:complete